MGYPIYHSAYTAAQIEASIGKTPRIKAATRTWEIWDISTSAYVDTGVSIDTELFVDATLTEAGYAADAKVTGDKLGELKSQINAVDNKANSAFLSDSDSLVVSFVGAQYPTGNVGDTISFTSSPNWKLSSANVFAGLPYIFRVTTFYTSVYTIVFTDASGKIVAKYGVGRAYENKDEYFYIVAPENAVKVFLSKHSTTVSDICEAYLYNGKNVSFSSFAVVDPVFTAGNYISYSNGQESASSHGRCTDYIDIGSYRHITYRGKIGDSANLVSFYTTSKSYRSDLSIRGSGVSVLSSGIIDLTQSQYSNIRYVRFSEWNANDDFSGFYFALDKGINLPEIIRNETEPLKEELSGEIDAVPTFGKVLQGKTINAFGDSITSTDYITPNWWQQIATRTGATFNNYGVSGTPIAQKDNINNSFVDRVTSLDTSADGVIIMGGTNDTYTKLGTWDSTDKKTFYGALNYIIVTLLNNFEGKPIIFCTPIQRKADYPDNVPNALQVLNSKTADDTMSVEIRAEAIKAKCHQYGIPCLDLYSQSGISGVNDAYYTDSLHPSAMGQKRLSNIIQSALSVLFIS